MSSRDSISVDDVATVEDAVGQLNAIEQLLDGLSDDDEYMRAILQNQALRLRTEIARGTFGSDSPVGGVARGDLPTGTIGTPLRGAYEQETVPVLWEIEGTEFVEDALAVTEVSASDQAIVVGEGNQISTLQEEYGYSEQTDRGRSASAFNQVETPTGVSGSGDRGNVTGIDEGVVIPTDSSSRIIKADVSNTAHLVEIGATPVPDDFTTYEYYVDDLSDPEIGPLKRPLGTLARPYRFTIPLVVEDFVAIRVVRDDATIIEATQPEDTFYARVRYLEV